MPVEVGPAPGVAFGTLTLTGTPGTGDTGQAVLYTATIVDGNGQPIDPATLTATITAPDGSLTTAAAPAWTRITTGIFRYVDFPTLTGVYRTNVVSTNPNAADDITITIETTSTEAWTPTPDDVAALLTRRTIDATGIPTGHFTATTDPTTAQVDVLIALRAGEITAACGPIPQLLAQDARLVAVLGTAVLVEESFEDTNAALVALYSAQYELALKRLAAACAQVNDSGQVEPAGSPPPPLFNFPDIVGDPWVDATTKYTRW